MGEAALQIWIEESMNETHQEDAGEFQDINLIALGETDQDWLYGTD